jgi:Lon protease-like protein
LVLGLIGCLCVVTRPQGQGYNRSFGLVFGEGKSIASVGCLMRVERLDYAGDERNERFLTWNVGLERFKIVSSTRTHTRTLPGPQ